MLAAAGVALAAGVVATAGATPRSSPLVELALWHGAERAEVVAAPREEVGFATQRGSKAIYLVNLTGRFGHSIPDVSVDNPVKRYATLVVDARTFEVTEIANGTQPLNLERRFGEPQPLDLDR